MPAHRKTCPARYHTGQCSCWLLRPQQSVYVTTLRKIMAMEPHLEEAQKLVGPKAGQFAYDIVQEFGFPIPEYIEKAGIGGIFNWLAGYLANFSPVQAWLSQREQWVPKKLEVPTKVKEVKKIPRVLLVGGLGGSFPRYKAMLKELGWEADHMPHGRPESVHVYDWVLLAGGGALITPIMELCLKQGVRYCRNKQFSITWVKKIIMSINN